MLQQKNIDVRLHDENIRPADITSDVVGINLLGAPYIPLAIQKIQELKKTYGNQISIILGWQVLTTNGWLTKDQWNKLFGADVINGMGNYALEDFFLKNPLPKQEAVSLISMYDKISDEDFSLYCDHEMSLYVSQWCSQKCSFCAAQKWMTEKYRDMSILEADLRYVIERAQRLGKSWLKFYMSNLDVFQTPSQLAFFVTVVQKIKRESPDFNLTFRWLAGVPFFIKLHEHYPDLIHRLRSIGFTSAWYGVDGVGKKVRQGIKKPQNNEKNVLDTIRLTREEYDINPELLMVFGHDGIDTEATLQEAYDFTEHMVNTYQAIPRPHIAKPFIPGNDWRRQDKYQNIINEILIKQPELFQALDFTALPSRITHTNAALRKLAKEYFLMMCELPGNTTPPIIPYDMGQSRTEIEQIKMENQWKYDR